MFCGKVSFILMIIRLVMCMSNLFQVHVPLLVFKSSITDSFNASTTNVAAYVVIVVFRHHIVFRLQFQFIILVLKHLLVLSIQLTCAMRSKCHAIALRIELFIRLETQWYNILSSSVLDPHRNTINVFIVAYFVRSSKGLLPDDILFLEVWHLLLLIH